MTIDTNAMISITEANQNFSKVTRLVDERGTAIILKNNVPRYLVIDFSKADKLATVSDEEAIEALFLLSRNEGIIPAIESSHALAHAIRIARTGITGSVLVNLSGRGDKDLDFVVEKYGYGPDFLEKMGNTRGR